MLLGRLRALGHGKIEVLPARLRVEELCYLMRLAGTLMALLVSMGFLKDSFFMGLDWRVLKFRAYPAFAEAFLALSRAAVAAREKLEVLPPL